MALERPFRIGLSALLVLGLMGTVGWMGWVWAETSALDEAHRAYRSGDVKEAFRLARRAVSENPNSPKAFALLGELYYVQQDLDNARRAWQKALSLDPNWTEIQEKLDRLVRETKIERKLDKMDVHPFVVRLTKDGLPVRMETLRQMLRDAHRQIGQSFDYFPEGPIVVLLYPREDFKKVRQVSHRVAGLYDGKIRLPIDSDGMDETELQRILWHEYTHALVRDLAKDRCPLWLNEGIAVVQEARIRSIDTSQAQAAFRLGTLPTLERLWSEGHLEESRMPLYYQTAYLAVQYLVTRWGWRTLGRMLRELGEGASISEAVRSQYRRDLSSLEREWKGWLRRYL